MSMDLPIHIGALTILRPWWLFGLLLLPLLWRYAPSGGSDRGTWSRVVDARLLPFLLQGREGKATHSPRPYLVSAATLLLLALSGPAWELQSLPLARSQAARVAVFDLSPSMAASDLKPNRLARARYKLIDWLARQQDGQTGLVVFGGRAFAVAPLTSDVATLRNLAEVLEPGLMPVSGARADLGIRKAIELLEGAGINGGEIVLFTDGINRTAVRMSEELERRGIRLSILAVGTVAGAPVAMPGGGFLTDKDGDIVLPKLDRPRLQGLTSATGGRYAEIRADQSDLDRLSSDADRNPQGLALDGLTTSENQRQSEYWVDRGPWLLLLALPLCALLFRRGWFLVFLVALTPTLTLPRVAMADESNAEIASKQITDSGFSWNDLWQRRDQQAHQAMLDEDFERAEARAASPARQGAAAAAAERWNAAAEHFAADQNSNADADYNRGTALAQAGEFEQALEALDEALQLNPEHADAKANKEAIKEWLEQQQDEQQGDEQQGDEQQDDEQQGDEQQDDEQQGDEQQDDEQQGDEQQGDEQQDDEQQGDEQQGDEQQDGEQQGDEQSDEQAQREAEEAAQREAEEQAQREAEERAAQLAGGEEDSAEDAEAESAQLVDADDLSPEQRQALEQWLRRVPDDPGGLLRRKFQLEAQRRPAPIEPLDEDDSQW